MKNIRTLKIAVGLTLGTLAIVLSTHTLVAQEVTAQTALIPSTADVPAFHITAIQSSRGIDKRLPAMMYENSVEISPLTKNGVSLSVLTIEQGPGILIYKGTTPEGVTTILGYTPFDAGGQMVTIRNGVTTYRDKEGRTVRVFPPSAPEVGEHWRYNNDVLNKATIYLLDH